MSLSDYQPSRATRYLHRIPRFGHSRSIASLMSTDSVDDYKGGIIAFYVFLLMILFIWTVVLLVLKFYYGIHRVGCAAGGDVVDVKEMKKVYNLDKLERKQRIIRNWRVQTTCLIICMTLLSCTIIMIKFGLDPFINSLNDIHEMNDRIDSHAYRGIQTVTQLQNSYDKLRQIQQLGFPLLGTNFSLTLDMGCITNSSKLSSSTANLTLFGNQNNLTTVDLHLSNVTLELSDVFDWKKLQDELTSTMTNISTYDFNGAKSVLYQLTNGTTVVDDGIDTLNSHDWTIRFLVVIMNVVIIFMIVGILFVKDNIDYPAYQTFTSYILIPIFCTTLIATAIAIYFFSSVAVVNADFCAGGNEYGYRSPMGTAREVIAQYGYSANTFPYRALQFYEADCLSDDPFAMLKEVKSAVVTARIYTSNLHEAATEILSKCGSNNNSNSFISNGTLYAIGLDLSNIEGSMNAVLDLTDCSNISPLFRQLLYGSTCTDSVRGLATLYSMLLVITLLGFVVLSTRAAFYNPVIRGRRNKRREKEFEDYKMYMSDFYHTINWNINCIPEVCISNNTEEKSEGHRIDTYNSEATFNGMHNVISGTESESDGHVLVPAISLTEKNSPVAVSNTAMDKALTVAEVDDDDDDSYDSTYSIDAGEDQSVSSSSVFSIFMKRRVQALHESESNKNAEFGGSYDDLLSKMSSGSSLINRFRSRNGLLRSKRSLSLHPVNATPHHPYDHRINSHDEDDDDCSIENDENDSNIGVLLTPPILRHKLKPSPSISSSQRKRNLLLTAVPSSDVDDMSTSPLALELLPLSPASIESPNVIQQPNHSFFRDERYKSKRLAKGSLWSSVR